MLTTTGMLHFGVQQLALVEGEELCVSALGPNQVSTGSSVSKGAFTLKFAGREPITDRAGEALVGPSHVVMTA